MIKKILTGDYLPLVETMTVQEREAYQKRVGEWLVRDGGRLLSMTDRPMARAQTLMAMSVRWSKQDCEAVHEGARLLTPLMKVSDTWLPSQLWTKSAWRAIRQITSVLSEVKSEKLKVKNAISNAQPNKEQSEKSISAVSALSVGKKNSPAEKPTNTLPAKVTTPSLTGRAGGGSAGSSEEGPLIPVRPKHIDQYAHLLPQKTQERAGMVRGLLRELDVAREKMRLLMDDANAKPDARAAWARRATKLDDSLHSIYRELDAEWEKLVKSGRVKVDALGNAFINEELRMKDEEPSDKHELNSGQKARRRELRKWLIDLRRGKEGEAREKRIEQWRMNWKEYLTLEPLELALKDEKVVQAAAHFGIDLNALNE